MHLYLEYNYCMRRFIPVFTITFFLSLNFGAVIYINSSFLGQFFSTQMVSILFILSAVCNALLFIAAPGLLKYFGKERLLIFSLLILIAGALGLALSTTGMLAAISFVLYSSLLFIIYYLLDIFLEEMSVDSNTGEIRGLYLTCMSAGIAAGPILLLLLSLDGRLNRLYFIVSLLLVPPVLLAAYLFVIGKPDRTLQRSKALSIRQWWYNRPLRAVTLVKVALEIFFTLMIVYTPLYLHSVIGFAWAELGVIFSVALIPFVILEWPAGELADRFWGEKEMMSVGFFITGITLLAMPFLDKNFLIWMVILFLSRVGASLIEVTSDSYFFKKIDSADTGLLSIFRLSRPVGIAAGALIGALSLSIFSFEIIFFAIAIVMFLGLREALMIKDTL